MGLEFDCTVSFDRTPPSIDVIWQQLRERTGIEIFKHIFQEEEMAHFSYAYSKSDVVDVVITKEANEIMLIVPAPGRYLLGVTLTVLVDLGGKYPGKLPAWARKKYEGTNGYY